MTKNADQTHYPSRRSKDQEIGFNRREEDQNAIICPLISIDYIVYVIFVIRHKKYNGT